MKATHALAFVRNTDPTEWSRRGWNPHNRPLGWHATCRCGWTQWVVQQSEARDHFDRHKAAS